MNKPDHIIYMADEMLKIILVSTFSVVDLMCDVSSLIHLAGRTIGIKLNTFLVAKIIMCLRLYHLYSLLRQ